MIKFSRKYSAAQDKFFSLLPVDIAKDAEHAPKTNRLCLFISWFLYHHRSYLALHAWRRCMCVFNYKYINPPIKNHIWHIHIKQNFFMLNASVWLIRTSKSSYTMSASWLFGVAFAHEIGQITHHIWVVQRRGTHVRVWFNKLDNYWICIIVKYIWKRNINKKLYIKHGRRWEFGSTGMAEEIGEPPRAHTRQIGPWIRCWCTVQQLRRLFRAGFTFLAEGVSCVQMPSWSAWMRRRWFVGMGTIRDIGSSTIEASM